MRIAIPCGPASPAAPAAPPLTGAPETATASLDLIRTDGGTQSRVTKDFPTIEDYMDAMAEGVKFPPITVFYDGTDYWLADGFHRRDAAIGAGFQNIECEVHAGTREDAQWYSFGANKTNALRRTNDDRKRAILAALAHPRSAGLSDAVIAEHVGVTDRTVAGYRKKLTPKTSESALRTGRDGRTINVATIGKARRAIAPDLAVEVNMPDSPPADLVAPLVVPVVKATEELPQQVSVVVERPDAGVQPEVVRAVPGATCEMALAASAVPAAGKRQQMLDRAAKKRMVEALSSIRGHCRGLAVLDQARLHRSCTNDEIETWSAIAGELLMSIRGFRSKLTRRSS